MLSKKALDKGNLFYDRSERKIRASLEGKWRCGRAVPGEGGKALGRADVVTARKVTDFEEPYKWPFIGFRLHTSREQSRLPEVEPSPAPPGAGRRASLSDCSPRTEWTKAEGRRLGWAATCGSGRASVQVVGEPWQVPPSPSQGQDETQGSH